MKYTLFLLITTLLSACGSQQKNPLPCKSKDACLTDQKCECWCSVKCGYREKTAADHPVYIENDPNGKHCYCKQWDADHYQENCVEGKNVEQPPNSK